MQMTVKINRMPVSASDLQKWEKPGLKWVGFNLGIKTPKNEKVREQVDHLNREKVRISDDEILRKVKGKIRLMDWGINLALLISGKRHVYSETTIYADGLNAKYTADKINEINLNAAGNETYRRVNLSACPFHYILRATPEEKLEVVEGVGRFMLPLQMFIKYGDDTGLSIPRLTEFPYQSVGYATTGSGKIMGGVRHQFRDTENGIEARLCVQFPNACPKFIVKNHQYHLAIEFSNWLLWISENRE